MKIRFQAAAQGGPHLQPEVRGAAGLLRADGDAEHRDGGGRGDVRVEPGALHQRHPPRHRQRDEDGRRAAQPRAHELLAEDAGLLERQPRGLQAGATHLVEKRRAVRVRDVQLNGPFIPSFHNQFKVFL